MNSFLFGRFLVSLHYVNTAGVAARNDAVGTALLDRAVQLADELNVRYLELRHERRWTHPSLNYELTGKVHMRLELPAAAEALWNRLDAKVRNQIRKGEKQQLSIDWGGESLLPDFHAIFQPEHGAIWGMPNFSRRLFQAVSLTNSPITRRFASLALGRTPVAAALLLHGPGMTEVPTASSLREFNSTNANMLMYWHLLRRAIERKQRKFDFGRSTPGGGAFRFKQQWGALGEPAVWQYYVRRGDVGQMRPDNPRNQRLIRIWRHLFLGMGQPAQSARGSKVRGIPWVIAEGGIATNRAKRRNRRTS